jgi:serine/threonine protein kinase
MPISKVREFMRQILRQLESLHNASVIHTDLKPANVVLERDGSGVRIVDYGSSVRAGGREERRPTPGYLPLEAANRAPGRPEMDVWSAGCMFCECYTGRPLFDWTTFQPEKATAGSVKVAILEAVESRRDVSDTDREEFRELLMRMICVDVAQRIPVTDALSLPFFSPHRV